MTQSVNTEYLERLQDSVDKLDGKVESVAENQNLMMNLLQGNPINKNDKGVLGRIDMLEKRQNKSDATITKVKWVGYGIVAVLGIIWSLIKYVFVR